MTDVQPGGEVLTTTVNRTWMVKMVIFTVVLIGFGLWGLYDALVLYPTRGEVYAEYAKWRYLDAAKLAGKINATAEGSEPKARMEALEAKTPRSDLEQAEYDWLEGLLRVGRLDEAGPGISNPNGTLDELATKWKSQPQPPPLAAYDLPLQWSFVVVGFGLGLYVIMNIVRSSAKKFQWEPATSTLTLSDGKRVTPDMLADVDKRKWHKYFCSLVFHDGSPSVELDLLKYQGLEEWVLTMERIRFPERAAEADAEAAQQSEQPPAGGANVDEQKSA